MAFDTAFFAVALFLVVAAPVMIGIKAGLLRLYKQQGMRGGVKLGRQSGR